MRLAELGDDLSTTLGAPAGRARLGLVVAVALAAVATAATGPIAFVAFLSGPIARRLCGGRPSLAAPRSSAPWSSSCRTSPATTSSPTSTSRSASSRVPSAPSCRGHRRRGPSRKGLRSTLHPSGIAATPAADAADGRRRLRGPIRPGRPLRLPGPAARGLALGRELMRLRRPPVVEGLDLDVPAGKVTVVVGPNGCGKSTVLGGLSRLLRPTEGQCT